LSSLHLGDLAENRTPVLLALLPEVG
jgi:hypothetical protein